MNIYRTEFFAKCPANDIRITYALEIQTHRVIPVESILSEVEGIAKGFHEDIADRLMKLGGRQTLAADHHGVTITTLRERQGVE